MVFHLFLSKSDFFDAFDFVQDQGLDAFFQRIIQGHASDAGAMHTDVDDVIFQFDKLDITSVILNVWSDFFDRLFDLSDFFFSVH